MTPKTAEIISRTAAFRDNGISEETATATLGAQYQGRSLTEAAKTLGVEATAQAIAHEVYSRKTRKA